jgi:hypothetical protein
MIFAAFEEVSVKVAKLADFKIVSLSSDLEQETREHNAI